jgi:hypothetical protein
MARFGQGLIQGLINPGYELNTTGMMAGGLAGSIAERKKEEEKKAKVAQTVSTLMQDDSPQRIRQGAASLFQDDPQAAAMLLDRAKEVAQKMAQLTGVPEGGARAEANAMQGRVRAASEKGMAEREITDKEQAKKNALSTYVSAQGAGQLTPLIDSGVVTGENINKFIPKDANLSGKDRYLSVGGQVWDMVDKAFITPPEESKQDISLTELANLYSKNTAESVQAYLKDPLNNAPVPLTTQGAERGEVPATVERQFAEINKTSGSASVSLTQNRNLQQTLLSDPSKSTGIVSDLRTFALDVAGLRDAEEETKTTYLRNRNTEIINNLPPGVASDTDIRIFSQGFPKPNASSEEILRYLQVEEKMLAYGADMGLLADRHLQSQINPVNGQPGQKASMVGFVDKRTTYAKVMRKAERLIGEARANGDLEKERQLISQLSAALGFTPKLYE